MFITGLKNRFMSSYFTTMTFLLCEKKCKLSKDKATFGKISQRKKVVHF